jgi:predicted nucleic acid-binding Zn ribbon protein
MVIRRTQTRSLGEVISEFLKDSGLEKTLKEREILSQWDDIVGKYIAASTQSMYVKDRKLFIQIRSSVIKNELNQIRQGLVEEINRRAGFEMIDGIIIR